MFGFNKKKREQEPEITRETWMYRTICMNIDGAVEKTDCVEVPAMGLRISVVFYDAPQMLQMELYCEHPDFTDTITEFMVAPGETVQQQLQDLANQTMGLVLNPVLNALSHREGDWHTVTVLDTKHKFYASESASMSRCRDRQAFERYVPREEMWRRLHKEILPFLGRKSNYWIKLYESHFGDEINCEVRINNRIVPELTELLEKEVQECPARDWDQKQTVLLVQAPETCIKYPFTAKQVREYARQVIHILANTEDIDYNEMFEKILAMTGDASLSCELCILLPEIFSYLCIQNADIPNKQFVLCGEGLPENHSVRQTQIGSYGWIEEAVEQYLSTEQPSNDVLIKIINLSASAKAFLSAMEGGSNIKELRHAVAISVPEGYVLR